LQATNPDNFKLDNHLAQLREYITILEEECHNLGQNLGQTQDKLEMSNYELDQNGNKLNLLQKEHDDTCDKLKKLTTSNANKCKE